MAMPNTVLLVLIYGSLTAIATGLGALPFLFLKDLQPRTLAFTNAIASGLMLGASFGLLREGAVFGTPQTIIGGAAGIAFILIAEKLLAGRAVPFGDLSAVGARPILLMLVVMTVHSFSEGIAVGVAFGGGEKLATLITLAIAVHNIPEGMAISAVMRPKGSTIASCALWSIVSSLPQPLMAVPAFLFVHTFQEVLPYGLGFAAGAMVFMVVMELLPGAYESANRSTIALWVSLTFAAMVLFQKLF
jgi:zinc transporter ZupT